VCDSFLEIFKQLWLCSLTECNKILVQVTVYVYHINLNEMFDGVN